MRGTPQTMSSLTEYDRDILIELVDYFFQLKHSFLTVGISDLIIDPGFGFAKNTEQNYQILQRLAELQILQLPVLAGLSRKGMFWKPLDSQPENVLPATIAANFYALQQGASILRVHDVEAAVQARYVWQQLQHED